MHDLLLRALLEAGIGGDAGGRPGRLERGAVLCSDKEAGGSCCCSTDVARESKEACWWWHEVLVLAELIDLGWRITLS
jgi:hypothetical protein